MGRTGLYAAALALSLVALLAGSCASRPTPQPTLEAGNAAWARDTAIDYIRTNIGHAPPADIQWVEEDVAPAGLLGLGIIVYDSPGWTVNVSWPLEPEEDAAYDVVIADITLGWYWKGSVDPGGEVAEICVLSRG